MKKIIIQFGMIRSGSTLIYNILKELFPDYTIIKTHAHSRNWKEIFLKKIPLVCTYRDPLDIICSSIKRYEKLGTREVIDEQIKELKQNGFDDFIKLEKIPRFVDKNKLNLKYENFYNNFDYIFKELEDFFNIQISSNLRSKIERKLSIEEVKEKTRKFKTFEEYDINSHWHGKHISNNNGIPKSHINFFNQEDLNYLKFVYKDFRKKYLFDK